MVILRLFPFCFLKISILRYSQEQYDLRVENVSEHLGVNVRFFQSICIDSGENTYSFVYVSYLYFARLIKFKRLFRTIKVNCIVKL